MSITISEITNTSTHLSGNPIKVKATTSGIPAGATDYKILLKMVSTDGVLIGGPFEAGIAPVNNVAEFNISGYVDQAVERDMRWPIPTLYQGKWEGYQNQVYEVQLVPGERYINTANELVENYQDAWGAIYVVKGRMKNHNIALLNDAGSNWFAWYCTGGRWLTYMPATQKVSPYQPVKLWWKPPTTGLTFAYKIKAYYSDGTTDEYTGTPIMYYDVMFEFEAQPSTIGFTIDDGEKKLLYYEVWMEGTPNLEKRTFVLDHSYHENDYYLFADNQIGGIDCIWLSGNVVFAPTGQREIASKSFEPGSGSKRRTQYVSGNTRARRWKINSGFKSREEIEALQMLLDTPFAWLAVPPAGGSADIATYTIVPVTVANTEMELGNTMNDLLSIEIELTEAS